MGYPVAHVVLREHYVVRPHSLEDAPVRPADGLGPDVRNAEVDDSRRRQDAGFDIGPDADHGVAKIGDAELAEHLVTARVSLDDVGEQIGVMADRGPVAVDAEHLETEPDQLGAHGATEPAEADHRDLLAGAGGPVGAVPGSGASPRTLVSQ